MTTPFGVDGELATIGSAQIEAGLDLLAHPPDWLSAMEDPVRLRADLEHGIPELAAGSLILLSCKFKRARMEHGTWTAVCRLKIEDRRSGERREIDVHGTLVLPWSEAPAGSPDGAGFATTGWRCFLPDLRLDLVLPPSDLALSAMSWLTDPELSRAALERSISEGGTGLNDVRVAGCTPTVMRYREGRRCTIRYTLDYAPELRRPHWPDSVVGKVYQGDEGRGTYACMQALWSSPLRTSATVTIAEPLAFLPDSNVMVQGTVPGRCSLKELIKTSLAPDSPWGIETLVGPVRKAGRGLAELHASKAGGGPTVTWDSQVEAVHGAVEQLAAAVPALAGAVRPLVAGLDILSGDIPAGPLVSSHGSFRPAQILVDGDDIAFIDFDGFCRAEAGLDLSLFRLTLVDLCLRAITVDNSRLLGPVEQAACLQQLDELCGAFLAGYDEVGEISPGRLALWDALTCTMDVLDCWRKVKFEHLARRVAFLQHILRLESAA